MIGPHVGRDVHRVEAGDLLRVQRLLQRLGEREHGSVVAVQGAGRGGVRQVAVPRPVVGSVRGQQQAGANNLLLQPFDLPVEASDGVLLRVQRHLQIGDRLAQGRHDVAGRRGGSRRGEGGGVALVSLDLGEDEDCELDATPEEGGPQDCRVGGEGRGGDRLDCLGADVEEGALRGGGLERAVNKRVGIPDSPRQLGLTWWYWLGLTPSSARNCDNWSADQSLTPGVICRNVTASCGRRMRSVRCCFVCFAR